MLRSIVRCTLRPIVRAIVASCDRSYEHSWYPVTENTISRGTRRPVVRSIVGGTIDSTIYRRIVRPIVRSIVASYNRSYDQSRHQPIWDRRFEVLTITMDHVATDLPLAITHDLCDQSCVVSTNYQIFQIVWSQLHRNWS